MKRTTHNLSNRLLQYGALTAAVSGIPDASGQTINYVDMQDGGGPGVVVVLDLNGDAQGDFNIRNVYYLYNYAYYRSYLGIWPGLGNAVLGSEANSLIYPFALDEGAMISSGNSNWKSNFFYQTLIWSYCYSNSNWCGVTDKYLGLRFDDLSANTYYGWARLDVNAANDWTIKDYAFVFPPGTPIKAGEGRPLDIEDHLLSKSKIVVSNQNIKLFNLPEITNYKLYNLTGQSLLEGKTENNTEVIDVSSMSSGVYIVELENVSSKSILRKKIVF